MNSGVTKNSKQRACIYKTLVANAVHPTAEELLALVKAEMPSVNLATLYRNLRLLIAEGKVITVGTRDKERFDATVVPHAHMRCRVCKRTVDVMLTEDEVAAIARIGGEDFCLLYSGICDDCNKK